MEQNEQKEYLYDAFISYRHTDLDMFVAENLHKQMEAFKPPKSVLKKEGGRKKISRVFRDRDELPLASNLEDPILDALRQSEYLVVICSPRLKESMWCKKEIQTFIEMHGRRKILAVLVEGEPAESFPEELLYTESEELQEDGTYVTVKKPIEPLAADFRGANKGEVKKAMKSEILRLLAPMFGVSYDDLRQRHREQRIRKIATAVSVAGALGIAFGAYSTYTAIKIDTQKRQIEEQAVLLAQEQASYLADEAMDLFEHDNRPEAVKLAYSALSEHQGVKLPKTAKAERALAECLSVYDGSNAARASGQIETSGVISRMKASPEGSYMLTADKMGQLTLWDMVNRESIHEISDSCEVRDFGFIDENSYFYLSADEGLVKMTVSDSEKTLYTKDEDGLMDFFSGADLSPDRKTIVLQRMDSVDLVDAGSLKKIATYEGKNGLFNNKLSISSSAAYMVEQQEGDNYLVGIDLKSGEELFYTKLPKTDIYDCYCTGDSVYLAGFETDNFISGVSTVIAIDTQSGDVRYATELDTLLATKIYYAKGSGNENLFISGGSMSVMLDAQSGEYKMIYHIEEDIAEGTQADDGSFMLYTADGTVHFIEAKAPYSDMALPSIVCHDVVQFESTAAGLVGIVKNDSRMIFYSYLKNADSSLYEGDVAEVKEEGLLEDDAKSLAKEKGIEKANFVYSWVDMKDADLTLVCFVNNTVALYRTSTMELLQTYDDCQKGNADYCGKINGYFLVSIAHSGYLFDKNGELHAVIPQFKGVSKDEKQVVVYGRDIDGTNSSADIAIPVYSTDELMKKTEKYLDTLK